MTTPFEFVCLVGEGVISANACWEPVISCGYMHPPLIFFLPLLIVLHLWGKIGNTIGRRNRTPTPNIKVGLLYCVGGCITQELLSFGRPLERFVTKPWDR